MPLVIAKHAGFCTGVQRAVNSALELSKTHKGINTLGELVHNSSVVEKLNNLGVVAKSLEDINSEYIIIRSHGVSEEVVNTLKTRNKTIYDLTCPFVTRLHKLVSEYSKDGDTVIIVGDKKHPEVIGTLGWCKGDTYIVNSAEEAYSLPNIDKALVVAQTTFRNDLWDDICSYLKNNIKNISIKNTICTATRERQNAAKELAKIADAMIVIGGKNSANTFKLYDACKELCTKTILVERADEIPSGFADINKETVGITAGASTPEWSLKEVVTRMTDIEMKETVAQTEELTSMDQVDLNLQKIFPGKVIKGTVVSVSDTDIIVSIDGHKKEGCLSRENLADEDVKLGDEIEVEVVKGSDSDEYVRLSQRNILKRKVWDTLVSKNENNEIVVAEVKDVVKGGVVAFVQGVRAFIPASQFALRFIEDLSKFKGQKIEAKILEIDKAKRKLVLSRKAVLEEQEKQRKEEAWKKLAEGEVVEGTVKRLTNFGAFVDLGGVDGLIHITDLSWGRVKHPSDVVKPDQKVMVKILSLNPETEKIQLGLKQTVAHPWDNIEERFPIGSVVEGKVVRITTFGAFVEVAENLDGLVHISQCALHRINKVEDALSIGDVIKVKVIGINKEEKKLSLSVREVLSDEALDSDIEDLDIEDNE